MILANVSASEITKIGITHFHGDHCLGLTGVIQRLSLDRVTRVVKLYYPASGQRYVENLKNASIFHSTATIEEHPISSAGVIFRDEKFTLETELLAHTVESWGYRLQEPDSISTSREKLEVLGITGAEIGKAEKSRAN